MIEDNYDLLRRLAEGPKWVTDQPNILADEYLSKVVGELQQGLVFGVHSHYAGGRSGDPWACLDHQQFKEYISLSRPGDLHRIWSVRRLLDMNLALAHAKLSPATQPGRFIIPPNAAQTIKDYLVAEYNEIIYVFVSWDTRKAECDWADIDGYDAFLDEARAYSYTNCEAFVFPLTLIDNEEHYLVKAKSPNPKGEVPIDGPY